MHIEQPQDHGPCMFTFALEGEGGSALRQALRQAFQEEQSGALLLSDNHEWPHLAGRERYFKRAISPAAPQPMHAGRVHFMRTKECEEIEVALYGAWTLLSACKSQSSSIV